MGVKKHADTLSTSTIDSFSSTTKLTKSEVKIPIECRGTIPSKDDFYNPYEHRSLEHPTSVVGSLIHLLKSSLGTGILAMPNAFRNAGLLFGFIGTIAIGVLCTYCVYILVSISHEICKRAKIPSLGFSEACAAVFEYGPKPLRKFSSTVKVIVDGILILTCYMTISVYVVFVAESLKQLFDHWLPETELSIYQYMLILMCILLVTVQIRELKHLVPLSFLANIFMVISFFIMLYYLFEDIPNPADRDMFSSIGQLPIFFSTAVFAMEGIGLVIPIENNMEKPQYFLGCPGVLNVAMGIVVGLYATIGFFGYLKYGDQTEANVTLNLPVEEIPAQIVKFLIAMAVFFSYNLLFYVAVDIIWKKLLDSSVNGTVRRNIVQVLLRVVSVVVTITIATAVPDLEPIIGLVGAMSFSTLGLLVPAVVETIWRWDGELGVFKWRLIKNILLVALALFTFVSGTMQSIRLLMEEDDV